MAISGLLEGNTRHFCDCRPSDSGKSKLLGFGMNERISEPVTQTYVRTRWAPEIHSLYSPLGHHIEDEPGQILLRHPVLPRRRQQRLLVTCTRQNVVAHDRPPLDRQVQFTQVYYLGYNMLVQQAPPLLSLSQHSATILYGWENQPRFLAPDAHVVELRGLGAQCPSLYYHDADQAQFLREIRGPGQAEPRRKTFVVFRLPCTRGRGVESCPVLVASW